MIRRKTYDKLPLQGNVYPMPTMTYIEDDYMRFTILASQPSGVACLKPGKFILIICMQVQLRIENP
jgi:alpha-mannosidase II